MSRLIDADDIVYESIDSSDTMWHEYIFKTGIVAVRKEDIDIMPTIEPEQCWILTSERLPEKYDIYLCCFEDGDLYTEWLEDAQWARDIVKRDKIIAWMPLPEPYKENKDERD